MKHQTLFLTGGGSAGHVYPALAVLEELKRINPNLNVFWLGRKSSFEQKLILESSLAPHIHFLTICSGKLRRYFSLRNFIAPFMVAIGILQSLYLIKKHKPTVVFSKGGFVSVPIIIASKLLKIPSLTHESDLEPGLATKINAYFCSHIFVGFEKTKSYFPSKKVTYVGNPVRSIISLTCLASQKDWRKMHKIPDCLPIVFIQGGSLGAQQINQLVGEIKNSLQEEAFLIHQSGNGIPPLRTKNYWRIPFLKAENMAQILNVADLVVSRSGAGSLSELASLGKAMILIPLQKGSRGDQVKNSLYFQERGAALVLMDQLNAEGLKEQISNLLQNPEKRKRMGHKASKLASLNSAKICAELISEKFL